MDRNAYLSRLSANLARYVPEKERQDILRWYEEYFDDAGPGREREIIQQLGDPAALARRLAEERGYQGGKKGPKMWQVIVGAVIVAALSVPLMALNPIHQIFRNIDLGAVSTSVPVEMDEPTEWAGNPPHLGEYDIDAIYVNLSIGDVTIRSGDVDEPKVERTGPEDYVVDWYVSEDGTLFIDNYSVEAGTDLAGSVTVTLPGGLWLDEVYVWNDVGNIALENFSCANLDANTDVGDITAEGIAGEGYLNLCTGLGNVTFTGAPAMDTWLDAGTGDITAHLLCAEEACGYDLTATVGEVSVGDRACGGSESFYRDGCPQVYADTSTGDIDLTFEG